jgi:hypothetical protein
MSDIPQDSAGVETQCIASLFRGCVKSLISSLRLRGTKQEAIYKSLLIIWIASISDLAMTVKRAFDTPSIPASARNAQKTGDKISYGEQIQKSFIFIRLCVMSKISSIFVIDLLITK